MLKFLAETKLHRVTQIKGQKLFGNFETGLEMLLEDFRKRWPVSDWLTQRSVSSMVRPSETSCVTRNC